MGGFDAKPGDRIDVVYGVEASGFDGTLEIHIEDIRASESDGA